jgi:CRP/FNR family transcriptional regulator, cyclic AMP receptor protein
LASAVLVVVLLSVGAVSAQTVTTPLMKNADTSFQPSARGEPGHTQRLFISAHLDRPAECHARGMELRKAAFPTRAIPAFDAQAFLDSSGVAKTVVEYGRGETIFTQGDACEDVLYIQAGGVKLSVLSKTGREAVVAMLGPGDFFGEGCLAGQPMRVGSATAITPSVILAVGKARMIRLLHQQHAMSDRFISHMLARNIRIEEDLIDQLFNSSEKRLARALLLLARYGKQDKPVRAVPRISQETLAEMIGTTRSRVNFFLNKFKKLGFIEYNGQIPLKVNSSLLTVVLHD